MSSISRFLQKITWSNDRGANQATSARRGRIEGWRSNPCMFHPYACKVISYIWFRWTLICPSNNPTKTPSTGSRNPWLANDWWRCKSRLYNWDFLFLARVQELCIRGRHIYDRLNFLITRYILDGEK